MTVHYLKIEPRWLNRVRKNEKTAEVRLDDRDYQTGDHIILINTESNWDCVRRSITHVLREAPGLASGYVVLSLEDQRVTELARVRVENATLVRSNRSLRARAKSLTRQLAEARGGA